MKTPACCPCCGGPLRNDFSPKDHLILSCDKRVNHKFVGYCFKNQYDTMYKASIMVDSASQLEACWWFSPKEMAVYNLDINSKEGKNVVWLPWFEPDFANYKRLIEKVKTYIIFS